MSPLLASLDYCETICVFLLHSSNGCGSHFATMLSGCVSQTFLEDEFEDEEESEEELDGVEEEDSDEDEDENREGDQDDEDKD